MPGLNIVQPRPNELVVAEQDFNVSGIAFDRGWPEPTLIDSVSVRTDNGPAITAGLTPGHSGAQTVVNFDAKTRVSATEGPHIVSVTATNDLGRSVTKSVTVFVGIGPLVATFSGTSTLKTTHPRDSGSHLSIVTAFVEFSADRRTAILRLSPIQNISQPQPGVTMTVDVDIAPGGGRGAFDPSNGEFVIPATLNFRLRVDVLVWGTTITVSDTNSTLPLTLTTGSVTSPTGAFSDTGVVMSSTGFVVLVGDGQFSGGELNGQDASLVIAGTVSPRP
jgi:hypothetical protein